MNADPTWQQWYKYECYLIHYVSGYRGIHHTRDFNQNSVVPFKGVLDFDLQPHAGAAAGTLGFGVTKGMPALYGSYGPNMNTF